MVLDSSEGAVGLLNRWNRGSSRSDSGLLYRSFSLLLLISPSAPSGPLLACSRCWAGEDVHDDDEDGDEGDDCDDLRSGDIDCCC